MSTDIWYLIHSKELITSGATSQQVDGEDGLIDHMAIWDMAGRFEGWDSSEKKNIHVAICHF